MNNLKRFRATLAAGALLVVPVLTSACGDGDSPLGGGNPLCCSGETDFKIGGTVTASLSASAQAQVVAQSVADFAGIASAALDDITAACRGIATDLDATPAELAAEEAKTDREDKMRGFCTLAISKITTIKAQVKAAGSVSLVVEGPQCSASVSAKANCEAKCSVDGKCDIKANPPKCTGGKLEVSCKGTCMLEGSATMSCEGKCGATCKGSCTASGGVAVDCDGRCEGTCAAGGSASGTGAQADGSCKGTCQGTCKARAEAPALMCSGSCNGECSGSCTAEANVSAKCSGKCMGDFEPLKCEGGKLEGGCDVKAECKGSCDASVSAKAECTPPRVTYAFQGNASAEIIANFNKLKATLEANLPIVFSFVGKLEGMVEVSGNLAANISGVADIKIACIPVIVKAATDAVSDTKASLEVAGSLTGSVK